MAKTAKIDLTSQQDFDLKPRPTDDRELQQMRADFESLMNQPGWTRIVKVLDEKIAYFDEQIKSADFESIPAFELMRHRRNLCEQIRNMPIIIVGMREMADGVEPDLDPYEGDSIID